MVASLLQVISRGIQDERLTTIHAVYPFKKVWNRTGRLTTRWERLEFDHVPTFGQTASVRLIRKGHLITRLYLVATLPDLSTVQRRAQALAGTGQPAYPRFGWTNSAGHALVQQLTMEIGGSRVEQLDSQLLELIDEFHTPIEKVATVNRMILRADHGFTEQTFGWGAPAAPSQVVVPLPLWFARGDPGCAFPIDAVGAEDVRVSIQFRGLNGMYYTGTHPVAQAAQASVEDGAALWPMLGSKFYAQDPVAHPAVVATPLLDPATNQPLQMPIRMTLGDAYLMAEYVYLDQPEANRFRLADLQVPVVQHFAVAPFDSRGLQTARIAMNLPNPTRELSFMCQPYEAAAYNAHFLATRDLTGTVNTQPSNASTPWWPDAVGLSDTEAPTTLRPAFALSDAEPVAGYSIEYEGAVERFRTGAPAMYRSILPSYEMRKSPWHNRYYYTFPLAIQNGRTPISKTCGAANYDKVVKKELVVHFRPRYGTVSLDVGRFIVRVYSEAYNILRVYGSRAGLMFS